MPAVVGAMVKRLIAARPAIDGKRCTRCGTCIQVCPVAAKAVGWQDRAHARPPRYDYDRCIRCYCCQEACPEKAITVRAGLFGH